MSISRTVVITDPLGLHARPAADFVAQARTYSCAIALTAGEKQGNCKSLLSILKLGIAHGTEVTLTATGDDESTAVDELAAAMESTPEAASSP